MLKVAVPNKGTLSEPAAAMLREAGYRQRSDGRELTVIDQPNGVEFYFLRPKDIAVYVGSGDLDLGLTGRDLALDAGAGVHELLALGFGHSTFRFAAPAGREWHLTDLADRRIATAYPTLVRHYLADRDIEARVIRLDGAVEISVQLGLADAIADVVGSGRTLRSHGLVAFGEVVCQSEAVAVSRHPADEVDEEVTRLVARLRGVVTAQQYVMMEYNCPRSLLPAASEVTPGVESPTVSPLADTDWVAVRAMVLREQMNPVMDRLATLGARAILATDLRASRL